jgi:hypothetical protein
MPYGPSRPKVTVRGVAERTRENSESLRSLDDGANGARVTDSGTSRVSVRREVKHGRQLYERRPRPRTKIPCSSREPWLRRANARRSSPRKSSVYCANYLCRSSQECAGVIRRALECAAQTHHHGKATFPRTTTLRRTSEVLPPRAVNTISEKKAITEDGEVAREALCATDRTARPAQEDGAAD